MKPGSVIYIEGKGLLPNQIRLHMRKWGRLQGKKYFLPYNHTETLIEISLPVWNKYLREKYGEPIYYEGKLLMSCGARRRGAEMSPLGNYLKRHPKHLIKPPKVDLREDEIKRQEDYAIEVCYTNHRLYQHGMFLAWIHKIQTLGLAEWGDKTDRRVYCFELAHGFMRVVQRTEVKEILISVYHLYENKNY